MQFSVGGKEEQFSSDYFKKEIYFIPCVPRNAFWQTTKYRQYINYECIATFLVSLLALEEGIRD